MNKQFLNDKQREFLADILGKIAVYTFTIGIIAQVIQKKFSPKFTLIEIIIASFCVLLGLYFLRRYKKEI